jgi:glycosyltransferase involved in cell wall biosynthesis
MYRAIHSLLKRIRFLASFIKELGGLHIFAAKLLKVLFEGGIKGLIFKTKYIIQQSGLTSSVTIGTQEYRRWIEKYQQLDDEKRQRMSEQQSTFRRRPLISVIMPTYNSHPAWLAEAIESVRNQIYPHWELCIADDASTDRRVVALLQSYQNRDQRIKVVFRPGNDHISAASNSALKLASGEYIALLDHDDLLPEDAFFHVVHTINQNPDAALIYSDEDKIDNKGRRVDPYFKCDWNYSLFLGQNLINHLGIYKKDLVEQAGGFRTGFEGSQDYDLALRCIEKIQPSQIVHIPKVLYHWRQHKESAAEKSGNKPYAVLAGQQALIEHLQRTNTKADVEILPTLYYHIKYHLPPALPLITIIIPTHNNQALLERCILSIQSKTVYSNYELLIVDNNSDDSQTLAYFEQINHQPGISVINDERPFNFSAINNRAVEQARGDYILLLNDDTEIIEEGWLTEMAGIAVQRGVGAVGAKLIYPNKTIQHAGVVLGIGGVGGHIHKRMNISNFGYFGRTILTQDLSAVTAACMLIKKSVFVEAGGFDEENLSVAFNDVDLCLKIREKGYRIVFTPFAQLFHHESVSRGDDYHPVRIARFNQENEFMKKKWGKLLRYDPAYNPNLSLEREDFNLAWPPR